MMHELFRRADHRGSNVRLGLGTPYRRYAWPRVCVDRRRWAREHAAAMKPRRSRHINELDPQMVHGALRGKLRHFKALGSRARMFADSQATVAVAAKGRSSSQRFNAVLCRLNALCLAAFCAPFFARTRAADNPAVAPSR